MPKRGLPVTTIVSFQDLLSKSFLRSSVSFFLFSKKIGSCSVSAGKPSTTGLIFSPAGKVSLVSILGGSDPPVTIGP